MRLSFKQPCARTAAVVCIPLCTMYHQALGSSIWPCCSSATLCDWLLLHLQVSKTELLQVAPPDFLVELGVVPQGVNKTKEGQVRGNVFYKITKYSSASSPLMSDPLRLPDHASALLLCICWLSMQTAGHISMQRLVLKAYEVTCPYSPQL